MLGLSAATPAHAVKLKAIIGVPNLHESILTKDEASDVLELPGLERTLNFGVTLDINTGGRNSLAIDYYNLDATISGDYRVDSNSATGKINVEFILLGGRWTDASGFYLGGGVLYGDAKVSATVSGTQTSQSYQIPPFSSYGLTLGYDYIFGAKDDSGFTLGVHYMRELFFFDFLGVGLGYKF